jgi:hypothetical protein
MLSARASAQPGHGAMTFTVKFGRIREAFHDELEAIGESIAGMARLVGSAMTDHIGRRRRTRRRPNR